jgi:hypothetical protein
MVATHRLVAQRQFAPRMPPVAVGQEGIVAHDAGQRALGQAEHDDEVEIEADGERQRGDQHAVAESAHPSQVGVELQRQGAAEDIERGRRLDVVQGGQSIEDGVDPLGGPTLLVRPGRPLGVVAGDPCGEPSQPIDPDLPGLRLAVGLDEVVDQPQHDLA